jgi:hypothetical protein
VRGTTRERERERKRVKEEEGKSSRGGEFLEERVGTSDNQ